MRRLLVVLVSGCLLLTAGCGTSSVKGSTLQKEVSSDLAAKVGRKPDSVSCPHSLKAEKGATTRCTLSDRGQKYGVTVTTTSVDNGKVKFSIKVDDTPKG